MSVCWDGSSVDEANVTSDRHLNMEMHQSMFTVSFLNVRFVLTDLRNVFLVGQLCWNYEGFC